MNISYEFHPLTTRDYNQGYFWYEEKQKGLGDRFLKAVREKIEEILENPEVYGSRGNKKYREARVENFPYSIVYTHNKRKKKIFITAVHHMSKSPRDKFRK